MQRFEKTMNFASSPRQSSVFWLPVLCTQARAALVFGLLGSSTNVFATGLNCSPSSGNSSTVPILTGSNVRFSNTGARMYAVAGTPITPPIMAPSPTVERLRNCPRVTEASSRRAPGDREPP
jgi:hypothetical protein